MDIILQEKGCGEQMKNEYAFYMNIHDLYILMNQKME